MLQTGQHETDGKPEDEAARLYLRRSNKSRTLWKQDLAAFVLALENEGNAEHVPRHLL
jgi:hypothetical protein